MEYFPKVMRYTSLFFIVVIIFFSCDNPLRSDEIELELNQEFELTVGEEGTFPKENLTVGFSHVIEDSRCPKDWRCFVAGNGKVAVWFRKSNNDAISHELNTNYGSSETTYLSYLVRLIELKPYPVGDETIPPSDYSIILRVNKVCNSSDKNFIL